MNIYEKSLLAVENLGISQKDIPIVFPDADIYKIKYEDKYGRQLLAAGEKEKVKRTLLKAGYKVTIEK
jgi:hypothetical protein